MGCIFPVITTAVQNAVPREVMGTATAAGLMFRQIGGSLAVAAFGAIFAARLAAALGGVGADMPDGRDRAADARRACRRGAGRRSGDGVAAALHPIFWIAAGLAAAGPRLRAGRSRRCRSPAGRSPRGE